MSDPAQQPPTPPAPSTPAATPPSAAIPSEQPQVWAPPGAAPFGAPAGTAPAATAYAPPPGYAPPAGHAAGGAASGPVSGAAAPAPGYYGAPTSAPSYGAPAYLQAAPTDTPPRRGLGLVALLLALGATVGTTAIAAAFAFTIALGEPGVLDIFDVDFDWSLLTPTRGWVLLGEMAFWLGTALGIWAIVQGLIAAVTRRGRATGIVAIAVAAVGPVVFGLGVMFALVLGATAGTV